MTPLRHTNRRHAQRGVGALVITLLLLFSASVGVLYVNRGVLFEQRAAANQMQSTLAQEVAEAGIEWATGMLNNVATVDTSCQPDVGGKTFRARYVQTTPGSLNVVPTTTKFPGCMVNPADGTMTCNCTDADGAVSLGSNSSFTLSFAAVDNDSVRVTAEACSASTAGQTCVEANSNSFDGHARVSVILKLKPVLRAAPAAPLTCGTFCEVDGSFKVVNNDISTNGVLVNAGTYIDIKAPEKNLDTIPGLPAENALIGSDASLANLSSKDPTCSNSAMFNAYFGSTLDGYAQASTTTTISCNTPIDCKSQLDAAYALGKRNFYFPDGLQLSGNSTYGSQDQPITIVSPKSIKINGTNTFWGLIFSNDASWNDGGTGNATINGAQISCAGFNSNGNTTLTYDADALRNVQRSTALMVRVPGSWRDF